MFQVHLDLRSRGVTGQRQGFVGGQVVGFVGLPQHLADDAVHALGVVRAGREQVHQQQMHADLQGGYGLGGEILDGLGAVLVRRGNDLHEGDEAMAADVAYRQRAPTGQRGGFDRLSAPDPGRSLGHGRSARGRE